MKQETLFLFYKDFIYLFEREKEREGVSVHEHELREEKQLPTEQGVQHRAQSQDLLSRPLGS